MRPVFFMKEPIFESGFGAGPRLAFAALPAAFRGSAEFEELPSESFGDSGELKSAGASDSADDPGGVETEVSSEPLDDSAFAFSLVSLRSSVVRLESTSFPARSVGVTCSELILSGPVVGKEVCAAG